MANGQAPAPQANPTTMAGVLRGSDYSAPEGGYFAGKMNPMGLGKYGQPRGAGGGSNQVGGGVISTIDMANALREFSSPADYAAEPDQDQPPGALTGENVTEIRPNDQGGWDARITLPDGSSQEIPVDSGEGSLMSDNPGFRLTTGEITQEDIRTPDTFNDDAELNEGQMSQVDEWRNAMGEGGTIWAYEPTTQMRVQIGYDQLAGAMDAGYRFEPDSIEQAAPEAAAAPTAPTAGGQVLAGGDVPFQGPVQNPNLQEEINQLRGGGGGGRAGTGKRGMRL